MDQHQGGTPPAEFASALEKLRILLDGFCNSEGEFAPHATLGQMSRTWRMRTPTFTCGSLGCSVDFTKIRLSDYATCQESASTETLREIGLL